MRKIHKFYSSLDVGFLFSLRALKGFLFALNPYLCQMHNFLSPNPFLFFSPFFLHPLHIKILIFSSLSFIVKAFCKLHISNITISFILFCFHLNKGRKARLISHQTVYMRMWSKKKRHRYFTICWCNQQILSCSFKPFFTPNQIALERKMILLTLEILWLQLLPISFCPLNPSSSL